MKYYELEFSRFWYDELIKLYNYFGWDINYEILSGNPNITWEIVLEHELEDVEDENPWDYSYLTLNKNISWSNIEYDLCSENPKNWDFFWITQREDIDIEFIEKYPEYDWNFDWLSFHPKITWEYIQKTNFEWSYEWMSENPNITWDIIQKNEKPWNFGIASKNLNIPLETIISDLNSENPKPWDFHWLSRRKDITFDIVKKYLNLNWDYRQIALNSNIKWEDIKELDKIKESFIANNIKALSYNPNIIFENIKERKDLEWDYIILSEHPNVAFENIEETFKKGKKIIIKNSVKNTWDSSHLSLNPNIDFDIIYKCEKDNHILWNSEILLQNPMTTWKNRFIEERKRIRESIKKELIKITSQPGYFFKNVLSKDEIIEMGFHDPEGLIEESTKYKVNFRKK